jgi:hypothetical protein
VRGVACEDVDSRAHAGRFEFDVRDRRGDQLLRLREEDELLEERGEQRGPVACLDVDRARPRGIAVGAEQLRQSVGGLHEHALLGRRLQLDLELRGVVDPAVHRRA